MADGTRDGSTFEMNKLKVFVSYSRDDLDFADQLAAALQIAGFDPIIDRQGISGGEAWQQRLGSLILEADTVVFVLSPSSARSEVCAWEVEEAVKNGKRILPVLARPLEDAHPPARLQDLNYMFFYHEPKSPGSGFGVGLSRLVSALNTDLGWIREHTRLLERATEWHAGGRAASRLLSGTDIVQAKAWAARRPKGAPEPTPVHVEYIRASEQEEAGRATVERKRLDEMAAAQAERAKALAAAEAAVRNAAEALRARNRARTIITWGSVVFAVVVAAAGIAAGLQWRIADQQRAVANEQRGMAVTAKEEANYNLYQAQVTRSRALVDLAKDHINSGDHTVALLLTLEALAGKDHVSGPRFYIPEADQVLATGVRNSRELLQLKDKAGNGFGVALTPDGTRIVTGAPDNAAQVWDAKTGLPLFQLTGHDGEVWGVAVTHDGTRIVTGSEDKTARVWDSKTGKELVQLKGHSGTVHGVSVMPDDARIVTASEDSTARVWDAKTGVEQLKLTGHTKGVMRVAVSPDGSRIVTGSNDNTARIWDAKTGAELLQLKGHTGAVYGVAVTADGTRVVTGSWGDRTVRMWDARTGAELFQIPGHKGDINHVAILPNGSSIVTVSDDRTVRVWSATKPPPTSLIRRLFSQAALSTPPLGGHGNWVTGLALTRDGSRAVTASRDGVVRVWDMARDPSLPPKDEHLKRAKEVTWRCLSLDERLQFLLRPDPPEWCKSQSKYPYDTPAWKTPGAKDREIAVKFGNFADAALYKGDFPSALEAANLASQYDPSVLWFNINRAHALMFLNKKEEARALYLAKENRGKEIPDHDLWEVSIMKDFDKLRAKNLKDNLMQEIEDEFKKPAPAK